MLTFENKMQVNDLDSLFACFLFVFCLCFFCVCVCVFLHVFFLTKNITTVPFCLSVKLFISIFFKTTWYQCVIDTDSL